MQLIVLLHTLTDIDNNVIQPALNIFGPQAMVVNNDSHAI